MPTFRSPVIQILFALFLIALFAGCATSETAPGARAQALRGTRATYCNAPRGPEGRVDVDRLISELVESHANTYSFCIHRAATDWDDLKLILRAARKKDIRIWASIVPPSESPPRTKM